MGYKRAIQPQQTGLSRDELDALQAPAQVMIRTRSPFARYWTGEAIELGPLLDQLRANDDGLPLTVVVAPAADAHPPLQSWLFEHLSPERDAAWILEGDVADQEAADSRFPVARLQPVNPLDHRIASNLVADVLFWLDPRDREPPFRGWLARAGLLILRDGLAEHDAFADDAARAGRPMLFVDRQFVHYRPAAQWLMQRVHELLRPKDVTELTPDDLNAIGKIFTRLALHLAELPAQRGAFRACLHSLLAEHGGRKSWNSDLVELAHRWEWPDWMVQTLPQLYVPLRNEDDEVFAYVWQPFVKWIDGWAERCVERLCGGQFVQIRLNRGDAAYINSIHADLQKSLRAGNYQMTGAFYGFVAIAIEDHLGEFDAAGRAGEYQLLKDLSSDLAGGNFTESAHGSLRSA